MIDSIKNLLRKIPGWIWMILCSFFFSITGVLVAWQVNSVGTNIFWIGWGRFFFGMLIMLIPSLCGLWNLKINNKKCFIKRGVYGSLGQFLFFATVALVGLGKGASLSYILCIIGTIAGIVILKEKPSAIIWLAVVTALGGVILCCDTGFPHGAEWLAIGCAFFSGITLPYIKLLRKTDSNQTVYFSQGLCGTFLILPVLFFYPFPHTISAVLIILLIAVSDTVAQLCMSQGMKLLDVAKSSALILLTPLFSIFFGIIIFDEKLLLKQWAGALLIFISTIVAIKAKRNIVSN